MSDMRQALARFIAEKTDGPAEVHELSRISGGFSYETWSARAKWRGGEGHLVVRREPRGGVLEPYDASKEFRILRALEATRVPVPKALWLEDTGEVLGTRFYIMEFVEGEIPLPWDESIPNDVRQEMHRQFTDMLAAMHTLDWKALGLDFLGVPTDAMDPGALELERCREILDRVELRPYPLLREILAWLDERRPKSPMLSLIHNDFRMGNFVWRDGKIVTLLDWERAFIGDPMVDVAFSRLENLAGWCSITDGMAKRYTEKSGIAIDEERVSFYETLEQLKATLVGLTGLRAFADGRTSDLRLVQIGAFGEQAVPSLAKAIGVGS
ncbi:MAG: phosphotransferase family protein [Candidatus Binatia bacterium]|nr:phosphotransferase family protein [Candidatus Binatia bacterium]